MSCSFCASSRPTVSVGPPGGKGTMIFTGCFGKSVCAPAGAAAMARTPAKRPAQSLVQLTLSPLCCRDEAKMERCFVTLADCFVKWNHVSKKDERMGSAVAAAKDEVSALARGLAVLRAVA